ncbi:HAD family phosphatase [Nocardia sp. NPDC005978]|uniref:HAD family hydrolase n=1 Tax=unclassified Nocardia TaxID=2637762 RepID=UPI0033BD7C5C
MSERVDAVLFDLDGTLVGSMDPWDRCWVDYAAQHGHSWTDSDRARTHGHGDWADHLAHVCGSDSPARVVEACTDLMIGQIQQGQVALLPGIAELIEAAADHAITGIVSASPRRFVHATLRYFDLHRYFPLVLTREDHPHSKPHPAPYLHAAELLYLSPAHCVAVEDSPAGIRSAAGAGMRVLAIPHPATLIAPADAALVTHLAANALAAAPWLRNQLGRNADQALIP